MRVCCCVERFSREHRASYLADQLKLEETSSSMAQVFRLDTPRMLVAEYPEAPTPPPEPVEDGKSEGVVVSSKSAESQGPP